MQAYSKLASTLILVATGWLIPASGFAQDDGNILEYNGNKIEFERSYHPPVWKEVNPKTGKEETKFQSLANRPLKINGEKVYCSMFDKGVLKPKIRSNDVSLADYLLRLTTPEFNKLADGEYNLMIGNVIIDASGKIVFYENNGIFKIGAHADEKKTKKGPIMNKIVALLNSDSLRFQPATVGGKAVNYLITNTIGYRNNDEITVKNHKMKWNSIEEQ